MINWSTNRINPAVAARTALPGTTRQSTTTAPMASRGAQFRAADLQQGAPAQRGAAKDDDDKDKKESLFNRDEDKDKDKDEDEDGLGDANTDPDDSKDDDDRKDDDGKPVKTKS